MSVKDKLKNYLILQDIISRDTVWHSQVGGRTNKVWRIKGDKDLICKLYTNRHNNPLFGNNPLAEYMCLKWLENACIAPRVYKFLETPIGHVLLYHYIEGSVWSNDVGSVSELLNRVHNLKPIKMLRKLPGSSNDIKKSALCIINKLNFHHKSELIKICPQILIPDIEPALIHTDVVVGNLIFGNNKLKLIDWQCPANGDPVVDIAMFLSPGMHTLYSTNVLSTSDYNNFLLGLKPQVRDRYNTIGPLYHWRLAAYCLWKFEQGIKEYKNAASAEINFLNAIK